MKQANIRMQNHANKKRHARVFKVGDLVLLSTQDLAYAFLRPSSKLKARWTGPFKVNRKLSDLVYQVELPESWKIHPVFNVDRLKLYQTSEGKFSDQLLTPLPPEEVEGALEYEVEDIINHRWVGKGAKRTIEYLVLWKGYSLLESTYQSADDMKHSKELVTEYYKRKGLENLAN